MDTLDAEQPLLCTHCLCYRCAHIIVEKFPRLPGSWHVIEPLGDGVDFCGLRESSITISDAGFGPQSHCTQSASLSGIHERCLK